MWPLPLPPLLPLLCLWIRALKGHITQHSGHKGQNLKTETIIEIQLVRPTEVCGKVLSEKNG